MKNTQLRETSLEVYNKIKENGLLSRARMEVLAAIVVNEPCSCSDILDYYEATNREYSHSTVTSRFSELERLGVIRNTGNVKINRRGNHCIVWELTHELPVKIEKKKVKRSLRKMLEIATEALKNIHGESWLESPACFKISENALRKLNGLD